MAAALSVSVRTVDRWKREETMPRASQLRELQALAQAAEEAR